MMDDYDLYGLFISSTIWALQTFHNLYLSLYIYIEREKYIDIHMAVSILYCDPKRYGDKKLQQIVFGS